MKLKIHNHHQAEKDLINIWIYSCENWGANQANLYLDQINDAMTVIALNPQVGFNIDAVRAGYLKYPINKHIIFYKINHATINIIRVLGSDMDYNQHI